jgi:hypothetical protein
MANGAVLKSKLSAATFKICKRNFLTAWLEIENIAGHVIP